MALRRERNFQSRRPLQLLRRPDPELHLLQRAEGRLLPANESLHPVWRVGRAGWPPCFARTIRARSDERDQDQIPPLHLGHRSGRVAAFADREDLCAERLVPELPARGSGGLPISSEAKVLREMSFSIYQLRFG